METQNLMSIKVQRINTYIKSDIGRILLRPFNPTTKERSEKIIKRILSLSEKETTKRLNSIISQFKSRHRDITSFFLIRYNENRHHIPDQKKLTENRKLLIGAYFSLEYSIEAASLFNPSMIWHPDQTGIPKESKRFIISLRATGEGHISSMEFRSGVIYAKNQIIMDDQSRLASLPNYQTTSDGYIAKFSPDYPLSERVLFPFLPEEVNGIEDARFIHFSDEKGNKTFYATYTAYDGKKIYSMLLETVDFLQFKIRKLTGPIIENKGLALFPRKINSKYVMLSRQDNENNFIMFSDRLDYWNDKTLIMEPEFPWEFFQIGNCGCPIETESGWLVLAHGVGAMRKYVISAFLLDLNDPTKVIGRLKQPLVMSNEEEREGYVPNVVYTCGGQIWGQSLVFPYAMSDFACSFALVNLNELLHELKAYK
jgi:predicted GH43/DUF377 family glycosyl hydrolase